MQEDNVFFVTKNDNEWNKLFMHCISAGNVNTSKHRTYIYVMYVGYTMITYMLATQ